MDPVFRYTEQQWNDIKSCARDTPVGGLTDRAERKLRQAAHEYLARSMSSDFLKQHNASRIELWTRIDEQAKALHDSLTRASERIQDPRLVRLYVRLLKSLTKLQDDA